jgi:ATP/maltotriose-dependent transcriptional regulator MalT
MNIGVLRARIQLMTDPLAALKVFERYESALDRLAMQGEYCAWRSLGFALAGQNKRAEEMVTHAESLSPRIEIRALTPWTRCIVATNRGRALTEPAHVAFQGALLSGNIDAFVTTYRIFPPVLASLASSPANHRQLKEILAEAHDHLLAETFGLRLPPSPEEEGLSILSSREREVLACVTQGLTNKQIGRTLFIQEVTVKAHMRKICQKLGVRTRTEAAMRATEFSD